METFCGGFVYRLATIVMLANWPEAGGTKGKEVSVKTSDMVDPLECRDVCGIPAAPNKALQHLNRFLET